MSADNLLGVDWHRELKATVDSLTLVIDTDQQEGTYVLKPYDAWNLRCSMDDVRYLLETESPDEDGAAWNHISEYVTKLQNLVSNGISEARKWGFTEEHRTLQGLTSHESSLRRVVKLGTPHALIASRRFQPTAAGVDGEKERFLKVVTTGPDGSPSEMTMYASPCQPCQTSKRKCDRHVPCGTCSKGRKKECYP